MKDLKADVEKLVLDNIGEIDELVECVYVILTKNDLGQFLTIGSTSNVPNTVRKTMLEEAAGVFGVDDAHS